MDSGQYVLVNEGFTRITGWSATEALGRNSADLKLWVNYDQRNEVLRRLVQLEPVDDFEATFRHRDGQLIEGVIFGRVVKAGNTSFVVTLTRDLMAQRALERKVKEAERLDSVGRLAGGVAHDFNNLLTVIQGNLELALARLPAEHAARAELETTMAASQQAAAVTRQLLAFGRKQFLHTRAVDLNAALEQMRDLIRRVLGELGQGTTFHLDFARSAEPVPVPAALPVAPSAVTQPRTVLVAEDEPSVGKLARRVLQDAGYVVLLAHDAESAEALALAHQGPIDLLLTDVVMPKVSGRVFLIA